MPRSVCATGRPPLQALRCTKPQVTSSQAAMLSEHFLNNVVQLNLTDPFMHGAERESHPATRECQPGCLFPSSCLACMLFSEPRPTHTHLVERALPPSTSQKWSCGSEGKNRGSPPELQRVHINAQSLAPSISTARQQQWRHWRQGWRQQRQDCATAHQRHDPPCRVSAPGSNRCSCLAGADTPVGWALARGALLAAVVAP